MVAVSVVGFFGQCKSMRFFVAQADGDGWIKKRKKKTILKNMPYCIKVPLKHANE